MLCVSAACRYTPRSGITADLVESLTFTASDGKGGFVTGNITINISAFCSCCSCGCSCRICSFLCVPLLAAT